MNTLEFFKRILPDDGTYCLSTIDSEGRTKNTFFATTTDLQKAAITTNPSVHVYHACATYKAPGNRKQNNVHKVKSFWLDVDVREDKGYQTFEQAFNGLATFLASSGLPTPLTVFSGSGIHLYWPLDEELDEPTWKKYAVGLKTLCERSKFKVDPGITADSARILRTPGTINLKNGNEAKVLNDVGPYSLSQFSILTFQSIKTDAISTEKKKYPKDADIRKIAKKCAQIAKFEAGDEQTGQTWIACGRVLAQCGNADEALWHEWSSKDQRYNEEEATKKWKDSVAFDQGITCDHFRTVNPEGCAGCKFKVKSPVQLGRGNYNIRGQDLPEEVQAEIEEHVVPFPFMINSVGAIIIEDKKGEENDAKEIEVSKFPFFVSDRTTSELDPSQQAIMIRHWTPIDGWRQGELTLGEYGSAPIAGLTRIGVMVTNERLARDYIRQSYQELATNKPMTEIHDTFGWKGDKFLLGDKLYYFADGKLSYHIVHLGSEAKALAAHLCMGGAKQRGSVQAWREAAQRLFALGHEWQAITLLVAAGAPLLALLEDVEGGTIWSLFDEAGGKGKTTATIAGATLWGGWEGLSTQAADTINARMAKLGTLKHLPLAYDEMKRDNPGIAKQFVQTFTAGTERGRLNRNANMSRAPRSWRTFMLTSANSELVGAIAADQGSEAMSDRVFEIHASSLPLRKGELDNQLKNEFIVNCGYAGPIILALILKNLDAVKEEVIAKEKYYMNRLNNSKLRFRAQLIAVVEVIGKLIAESELLTFDHNDYVKWLLKHVTETSEEIETPLASDFLARYIREHQNSILYTKQFTPGSVKVRHDPPHSGKVNIRVETDTHFIIIPRKDLEVWLQKKDQSIRSFIKDMEEKGILEAKNVKRTLTAGTTLTSALESVLIFRGNHEELSGIEKVVPLQKLLPIQEKELSQERPASSLRLEALRGYS